jgi:phosphoglucomutase
MIENLRRKIGALVGARTQAGNVVKADDYRYVDPVDGSISDRQGLRVELEGGARIVYRLSGTGTEGATLRVYVERFEPPQGRHDLDATDALADTIAAAKALAEIELRTGRNAPDVIQ